MTGRLPHRHCSMCAGSWTRKEPLMANEERHEHAGQYSPSFVSFHIARDPEFLQGLQDGRTLLPQEWDLAGQHGWWNVQDLVQLILMELSPESHAKENQVRQC